MTRLFLSLILLVLAPVSNALPIDAESYVRAYSSFSYTDPILGRQFLESESIDPGSASLSNSIDTSRVECGVHQSALSHHA